MISPIHRSGAALLLVIGLAACDVTGLVCTAQLVPGIRLTVVDSASGGPVASVVRAAATQGSFSDTVTIAGSGAAGGIFLVNERAGTYDVEVTATGYLPWRQEDVRVTEDQCHVRTVELTARLRQ